jgi:hypothetical protein
VIVDALLRCVGPSRITPEGALLVLRILRHLCGLQENVLLIITTPNAFSEVQEAVQLVARHYGRAGPAPALNSLVQDEIQLCTQQLDDLRKYQRAFLPEVDRLFGAAFGHADHVINSWVCKMETRVFDRTGRLYATYNSLGFHSQRRTILLPWARVVAVDTVPQKCWRAPRMRIRMVSGSILGFYGFKHLEDAIMCLNYIREEVISTGHGPPFSLASGSDTEGQWTEVSQV